MMIYVIRYRHIYPDIYGDRIKNTPGIQNEQGRKEDHDKDHGRKQ